MVDYGDREQSIFSSWDKIDGWLKKRCPRGRDHIEPTVELLNEFTTCYPADEPIDEEQLRTRTLRVAKRHWARLGNKRSLSTSALLDQLDPQAAPPDEAAILKDDFRQIERKLKPADRDDFLSAYGIFGEELTLKELAVRRGKSPLALQKRFYRIKRELRILFSSDRRRA